MDIKEKHLQRDLQRVRALRLMDDEFMSKCFEDYVCVELVLRIILDKEDIKVEDVKTQYKVKNLQGRSIIMDIYATDSFGKKYNIEIQRSDRGAGARRARYHSSLMDADVAEPGEKLENLEETYVIFITENDVLRKKLPIYHVDRVIIETGEYFGDDAHILYVNGSYRDDSPIGKLMHDFSCAEPDQMIYEPLAKRTRYFKEEEKGAGSMSRIVEEWCNEAAKEAEKETQKRIIVKMLSKGVLTVKEVADAIELPIADVEAIASELEKTH